MRTSLLVILMIFSIIAGAQVLRQDTLFFPSGSTAPVPRSAGRLAELRDWLARQAQPVSVTVSGYADPHGDASANELLSGQRAQAVLAALRPALPAGARSDAQGRGVPASGDDAADRRAVVTIVQPAPEAHAPLGLEPFFQDVPLQTFSISLDDTARVTGAGGTRLRIAPGSVQAKGGGAARGQATLLLREYYEPGDILLAGLHSSSDRGLLQSGGMVYFRIVQNGDTLPASFLRPVEIRMPVVKNDLDGMNVFVQGADSAARPTGHDSAAMAGSWRSTVRGFQRTFSYWALPRQSPAFRDFDFHNDPYYTALPVGARCEDQYRVLPMNFLSWEREGHVARKPLTRRLTYVLEKTDSVTLRLHARISYRARGRRATGKSRIDTTVIVPYFRPEFIAELEGASWINCDRFLNAPEPRVDLYVKTPGYRGGQVLAYFPSVRAFMQSEPSGETFALRNIPRGLPVMLLAIGRKGGGYYFGRLETEVIAGATTIELGAQTKDFILSQMRSL